MEVGRGGVAPGVKILPETAQEPVIESRTLIFPPIDKPTPLCFFWAARSNTCVVILCTAILYVHNVPDLPFTGVPLTGCAISPAP